jgi:hypothetical protein
MWRRMREHRPWSWQSALYVSRCMRAGHIGMQSLISFPVAWPTDELLHVQANWPSFPGSPQLCLEVHTPGLNPATGGWVEACRGPTGVWLRGPATRTDRANVEVRVMLDRAEVRRATVTGRLRVGGSRETFLERVAGPEEDGRVRAALGPRLVKDASGRWAVAYHDRSTRPGWAGIDYGVDFRVNVLVDGRSVGGAVGMALWGRPDYLPDQRALVIFDEGGRERLERALSEGGEPVRLRTTGAPDRATLSFINNPFNKARAVCWAGTFEVPAGMTDEPSGATPTQANDGNQ